MKLQFLTSPGSDTIRLVGDLDLYQVAAARAALLNELAGRPGLELDLSGIANCDAAGLQLLIAAGRSAALAGKTFCIQAAAPAIGECSQLLGLTLETGQPPAN
ncbi:MAG: STAS domain-containing protein [Verrucomicrobiae bacterium]|nr:STAS domain-containing protein [Verrucomicrobiae bacterium]